MRVIRSFWFKHRQAALLLVLLALCVKALVPAGYMPSSDQGFMTVSLCADGTGADRTMRIAIPGKAGSAEPSPHEKAQAASHCAFAGLAGLATGGADLDLQILALAVAMLLALCAAVIPPVTRAVYLRPPSRGPPATL